MATAPLISGMPRYLCFANNRYYPWGGALDYHTEVASRDAALAWCADMVRKTAPRSLGWGDTPCECSVLVLEDDGRVERLNYLPAEDDGSGHEFVVEDAPDLLR